MTKAQVKETTGILHQWMTLVGIPVIAFMMGDMYMDFKKTRDESIRHTEQIQTLQHQVEKHEQSITTISTYLFNRHP